MIWKTTILLSTALCVLGDGHHAISEQRIKIIHKEHSKEHHGHHGELSHIGSKKPEHHEEYAWSYPSYEFSYKVHDPHTHDMKGQHESREGDEVKGEYWLVEPDGRKRTVTYHADKHSGFHATVHYSDDHHHEEPEKIHYHEEPKKEEEKKEEEAGGEESGEEEGEGQEEEKEGENEGAAVVEEVDEGRGAEESRGREEEVGKWIHDHHWGYRGNDRYNKHHDYKHEDKKRYDEHHYENFYMSRGNDRRLDGHYQKDNHMVRGDEGHKYDEHKHKSMSIFTGLGSYGRQHGHERAEWHGHDGKPVKDETREESRRRPEHRGFAQPKPKKVAVVRENYYHPRYYRQSEHQRKNLQ